MNRLPDFLRSYGGLIALVIAVVIGIVGYFWGTPFMSNDADPFFHLTHVLYSAMWSNMWAPSIWTLGGFMVADVRNVRRAEKLKVHHTSKVNDLVAQIDGLADRLVELMGGSANDTK